MSHFSCLVITYAPDVVTAALQPYHEYECTGTTDEFVVWVDHTDEVAEEWATSTSTAYRAPDGTVYQGVEDIFYRNPTPAEAKRLGPFSGTGCGQGISWTSKDWGDGRGYRAKVRFVPTGFVEFDQPIRDRYATMESYAEDYHGYTVNEAGRIGRFTNPNAKWDWWQIGGRYSGRLLLRDGSRVDQAQWRALDIGAMRDKAEREASADFAKLEAILGDLPLPPLSWAEMREKHPDNIDAAREEWRGYLAVQAMDADHDFSWDADKWIMVYRGGRAAYIAQKRRDALSSFAVVKGGQWHERGEMGWWACVSNEKDVSAWSEERERLLSDLAEDTWLTMVDCHI